MIPNLMAVVLTDRNHEMNESIGFVTGVCGEESRTGLTVGTDESEVTFVNPRTGDQAVHVVPNDALAIHGC